MSDSGSFYTAGNSPEADIGFYKQLRGYFKADPTRAAWQKKLDEEAKKMKQKQLEEEAKQLKQQLIKHETPPPAPTRQPSRWVSSNGGWTQEQVETDQGLSTPQDRGSPNLSGRLSHMGPSPSEAAEAWQRGDYSLTPNTAAADEAATTSAASETTTEVSMAASEPPNLASPATPHEVVAQPTELLVNSHAIRSRACAGGSRASSTAASRRDSTRRPYTAVRKATRRRESRRPLEAARCGSSGAMRSRPRSSSNPPVGRSSR